MRLFLLFSGGLLLAATRPSLLFVADALTLQESSSRRAFVAQSTAFVALESLFPVPAAAASPEIFTTPNGIKYATITPAKEKGSPAEKDIVAIEYTGYLKDGTIFGTFPSN